MREGMRGLKSARKPRFFPANEPSCNPLRSALALSLGLIGVSAADGNTNSAPRTYVLHPFQRFTLSSPKAPSEFNPDSGALPVPERLFDSESLRFELKSVFSEPPPPLPPAQFNPDPGTGSAAPQRRLEYLPEFRFLESTAGEDIPEGQQLPRPAVRRSVVLPVGETLEPEEPKLPADLALPRGPTRYNEPIRYEFHNLDAPLNRNELTLPPYMVPRPDRWRVGFAPWRRYTQGKAETPYETPVPRLWHPYKQSILKGDVPLIGQDIFLNLTASSTTEFEARRLPTPAGVSSARPDSAEFFGRGEQFGIQQYIGFSVDLFRGETAFKPVQWALRLQPVYNVNYAYARETGVISPDPRGPDARSEDEFAFRPMTDPADIDDILDGELHPVTDDLAGGDHTTRTKQYFALQEAFLEVHLADLSDNYDFLAFRGGSQVFSSDFRGFIFNDVNLGARIFGNASNNRFQYNAAAFEMREKETNSDLNTLEDRDQHVVIGNIYRQDFLWPGYTAQLSFHANFDDGDLHYDRNGSVVRPNPIGTLREHSLSAYYLGWAGDGHIGRLNLSHAFYQVLGHDEFNGLAGQEVDISAQMAALELSYDQDWIRYKASFFYASGDSDAEDSTGRGFDSILDNPNFTGGPFSYYVRQGFNFAGAAVNLKSRSSLLPNLRSSKSEGQANFVNPGVFIYGVGLELELTPKLRSFANANYIHFAEANPLETALVMNDINSEVGVDLSLGFQYRPFLTDNIIISTGFGTLLPGSGYKDIYRRMSEPVPGFQTHGRAGETEDFLYSGLLVLTLVY
jgi:hypothetical protein